MPRISAEDRAASMFRAGILPPAPPPGMGAPAARIWRRIAGDRPAGYFRPGSLELLERFCVAAAEARRVSRALRKADPLDGAYRRLLSFHTQLAASMTGLGMRLRLTVQASTRWRSGQLDERSLTGQAELDPLLGGRERGH